MCRPAYPWFNGYIAPPLINNATNGVTGLPADYVPYRTPINNTPGAPNYDTSNVQVPLKNGTSVLTGYSPGPAGPNPFWKTTIPGPSTRWLVNATDGIQQLTTSCWTPREIQLSA